MGEMNGRNQVRSPSSSMFSIRTLFDISKISITNIETAIIHLHKGNVPMYFSEIQKNFAELEGFAGSTNDFKTVGKFFL